MNAALLNKGAMATSKLEDLRKGKGMKGSREHVPQGSGSIGPCSAAARVCGPGGFVG